MNFSLNVQIFHHLYVNEYEVRNDVKVGKMSVICVPQYNKMDYYKCPRVNLIDLFMSQLSYNLNDVNCDVYIQYSDFDKLVCVLSRYISAEVQVKSFNVYKYDIVAIVSLYSMIIDNYYANTVETQLVEIVIRDCINKYHVDLKIHLYR